MLCEAGSKLDYALQQAHREREIAEKELSSESANRLQSERRLTKVLEVEQAAAVSLKRHKEGCAACKAGN